MKRIVISDESINSYGFWVNTDGIDLSAFLKNPVMLWNHNRSSLGTNFDQLPIGRWKDLRVENGVLTGEPVFDENDEFAVKIKQKYESGILNACSIGFTPLEWSDAPEMLKEGQTVATVTRCRLLEISICDIPSNANATVVLYDDENNVINLSDAVADTRGVSLPRLPKTNNKHLNNNNMTLQEIALKLGLEATATAEAIGAAITDLKSENAACHATMQNLEQENRQLKEKVEGFEQAQAEALKAEAERLLDEAVNDGRISAQDKPHYEALFAANHDAAKAVLASMEKRTPLKTAAPGTADGDLTKMSWDELDRADRLYELKTNHPEIYQQKFNEKFNKKH